MRRPQPPAQKLNNTAWTLLADGFEAVHDQEAALELARRAATLDERKDWNILNTLALALFRTGDVEATIETQLESRERLPTELESARPNLEANLSRFRAGR